MKSTSKIFWIATAVSVITGLCPVTLICLPIAIYFTNKESLNSQDTQRQKVERKKAEELKRQREAERREIDMVRKSNDILLHLIQDEHREEGDR